MGHGSFFGGGVDDLEQTFFVDGVEECTGADGGATEWSGEAQPPAAFAGGGSGLIEDTGIIDGVDVVTEENWAAGAGIDLLDAPFLGGGRLAGGGAQGGQAVAGDKNLIAADG